MDPEIAEEDELSTRGPLRTHKLTPILAAAMIRQSWWREVVSPWQHALMLGEKSLGSTLVGC